MNACALSPVLSVLVLAQDDELRVTPKPTQSDPDRSNAHVGVPNGELA